LTASIRDLRKELHRQLEEAKAQREHWLEIARSLVALAQSRNVPVEVQNVVERIERLTLRQRQVFEKVLAGQANKVIAFELGVSQKTVETHRARIMRKLGASSLAELVRISMRGLGADLRVARRS
jgi:FixJ family two-component response regulator